MPELVRIWLRTYTLFEVERLPNGNTYLRVMGHNTSGDLVEVKARLMIAAEDDLLRTLARRYRARGGMQAAIDAQVSAQEPPEPTTSEGGSEVADEAGGHL